jgi:Uma2 family endonuclease
MTQVQKIPAKLLVVKDFLEWAKKQPTGRYELVRGEVIAMTPERARHSLTKHEVAQTLKEAVRKAGLSCTVFPDGMTIIVDEDTSYEPDAVVQCGGHVDLDSVTVDEPLIVVEVLSPSTEVLDVSGKLVDYFRVASIKHYLIIDTRRRSVIHHQSNDGGNITTRVLNGGQLVLSPPGIEVDVSGFFIVEPSAGEPS